MHSDWRGAENETSAKRLFGCSVKPAATTFWRVVMAKPNALAHEGAAASCALASSISWRRAARDGGYPSHLCGGGVSMAAGGQRMKISTFARLRYLPAVAFGRRAALKGGSARCGA